MSLQHFANHRGRSNLDEDDVIQSNAIERVQECKLALNLVGFDHALQNVLDSHRLSLPREMISDGKNSTKVVGRVSPCKYVRA